jgi:hypothetical protein
MKPRSIVAIGLRNSHGDRSAVIVFESVNPKGLSLDAIRKVLATQGPILEGFMESMKRSEPSPLLARREGF